jgi:hypothetical protein
LSPPAPGRPAQRGASADIGVRPKRNDTRPLVLQYSVLQYSGSPVFLLSSIGNGGPLWALAGKPVRVTRSSPSEARPQDPGGWDLKPPWLYLRSAGGNSKSLDTPIPPTSVQ